MLIEERRLVTKIKSLKRLEKIEKIEKYKNDFSGIDFFFNMRNFNLFIIATN